MSDAQLVTFRDHCRRMSMATTVTPVRVDGRLVSCSQSERLLWARLADEIDHWLEHGLEEADDTEPLWEGNL